MHATAIMQKIEKVFGAVVREQRLRLGISQEEFAAKAGIHRTYASSIERGTVQVSIAVAVRLAAALEIPMSRLWRLVEKMKD